MDKITHDDPGKFTKAHYIQMFFVCGFFSTTITGLWITAFIIFVLKK